MTVLSVVTGLAGVGRPLGGHRARSVGAEPAGITSSTFVAKVTNSKTSVY